jgi:hypothetical protein
MLTSLSVSGVHPMSMAAIRSPFLSPRALAAPLSTYLFNVNMHSLHIP